MHPRIMSNLSSLDPGGSRAFAGRLGLWTQKRGNDEDIALTSRVRLARNIDGLRFRTKMDPAEAEAVCGQVMGALETVSIDGGTTWVPIDGAPPLLRLLMRERYLCSRELAPAEERDDGLPGRAVAFGIGEDLSIMVNEEDHLRLSAISPGFDLRTAHARVCELDRKLEEQLSFAYQSDLGYLTGCPTNVGTGMRASVMLHLPALGLVPSELDKVIRAAQRTGLAVRGMYGEGSRAVGDFYQISNQVTLGRTEEQLVEDLSNLIPSIADFERRVRAELHSSRAEEISAKVDGAFELLATTRSVATDGAMQALSTLRLGGLLGLPGGLVQPDFGSLVIQVQKGHVQVLGAEQDDTTEGADAIVSASVRDELRAAFLRRRFAAQ